MSNIRCERCSGKLRYAGEPCYTCSPAGWMTAYQQRQHGEPQNAGLARTWTAVSARVERRQASRGTYRRIRAETDDEQTIARHLAGRSEELAVIARAQARSRGSSPREISRSAAQAYARGPRADQCTGPSCPVCLAYGTRH